MHARVRLLLPYLSNLSGAYDRGAKKVARFRSAEYAALKEARAKEEGCATLRTALGGLTRAPGAGAPPGAGGDQRGADDALSIPYSVAAATLPFGAGRSELKRQASERPGLDGRMYGALLLHLPPPPFPSAPARDATRGADLAKPLISARFHPRARSLSPYQP